MNTGRAGSVQKYLRTELGILFCLNPNISIMSKGKATVLVINQ